LSIVLKFKGIIEDTKSGYPKILGRKLRCGLASVIGHKT